MVRCKLPRHDTSCYFRVQKQHTTQQTHTHRGLVEKVGRLRVTTYKRGYLLVAMKYDVCAISLVEAVTKHNVN